jgi:hypothetical protein
VVFVCGLLFTVQDARFVEFGLCHLNVRVKGLEVRRGRRGVIFLNFEAISSHGGARRG